MDISEAIEPVCASLGLIGDSKKERNSSQRRLTKRSNELVYVQLGVDEYVHEHVCVCVCVIGWKGQHVSALCVGGEVRGERGREREGGRKKRK